MLVLATVLAIVAFALLRAGETESGWSFAPLRATALLLSWAFRVVLFVAMLVFAFVVGAAGGAWRANL
nr:hypothetical protein [Rhodococcus sp. 06-1059B-a]